MLVGGLEQFFCFVYIRIIPIDFHMFQSGRKKTPSHGTPFYLSLDLFKDRYEALQIEAVTSGRVPEERLPADH